MEPCDEPDKSESPCLADDLLRLQGRVAIVERQVEAMLTIFQAAMLAAVIYIAWPYLSAAYSAATDKIPGVQHDP